jgi:hypothetical protein
LHYSVSRSLKTFFGAIIVAKQFPVQQNQALVIVLVHEGGVCTYTLSVLVKEEEYCHVRQRDKAEVGAQCNIFLSCSPSRVSCELQDFNFSCEAASFNMLLVLATAALLCWSSPALTQSVDDSACFVMENTSGQKKACLFPFGYEGKEYGFFFISYCLII